jgi:hypothetical protein
MNEHVERMCEKGNARRVFVGKRHGQSPLGEVLDVDGEDNIKMDGGSWTWMI